MFFMQQKKIGFFSALAVVIGCVIGSGVFVKPGLVLSNTGNSTQALLAWLVGGLITIAGALTLGEVATHLKNAGGIYGYIEELYGKKWGFLCGWVQSVLYGPALVSALSLYFSILLSQFFNLDPSWKTPVALITMFTLALLSFMGTHISSFIQNISTFAKLIPIAVIAILGLFLGQNQIIGVDLALAQPAAGFGAAVLATLWAYDGWVGVTNLSHEMSNPVKDLPRAMSVGLISVAVIYLLVNIALMHVLGPDQVSQLNEKAAGAAADQLLGSMGGKLISLGILISIFGCLNGNILTMSRVASTVAQASPEFKFSALLSKKHPSFGTPPYSILLTIICATVMILALDPDRITDISIFSMYLFYGAGFVGLFALRKKFGTPKGSDYKVPFFPVIPLFAFLGALYICLSMITKSPGDAVTSVLLGLSGLVIFTLARK
jgi:APA family basic amino acid/polyamine antiporter